LDRQVEVLKLRQIYQVEVRKDRMLALHTHQKRQQLEA
jgi:hypothetical protein